MTALTIVQDACGRMGLNRPNAVFTSTDQEVIQLRSLLNQSGKKLARIHDWRVITKEKTFTTVATSVQTSAVPTDFDRIINETMFNRTRSEKILGPLTPQEWQINQSGFNSFTVDSAFRFRGSDILITPDPTAGDDVYYEYVSKNWCQSDASVEQSALAVDSDTTFLDEELLTLAVMWRFYKAKGLDYAEAFNDYEIELANAKGRDGGNRILSMSNEYNAVGINIPEGNWNV